MTYDMALAEVAPPISSFAVNVNSTPVEIESITVSGTEVLLVLSSQVFSGDAVTVAYIKPAINPLQTSDGRQAASMADKSATNYSDIIRANQSPIIVLSAPSKGAQFIAPATILLEAIASDTDGIISKVEFFNGNIKLGESVNSPYAITWKDVNEGDYRITAVAVDNLHAQTVSESIPISVIKSASEINQLPSVSITAPDNQVKYEKHDNVLIKINATDPDGTIERVELDREGTIIAVLTEAPYNYLWQDVDTGTYTLCAYATDNLGAVAFSPTIQLLIEASSELSPVLVNLYPNPNNGIFSVTLQSGLPPDEKRALIFKLTGETLYDIFIPEEDRTLNFDLSSYGSGNYVFIIKTRDAILATKKFIVH